MALFAAPIKSENSYALRPTTGGTQVVNVLRDFQWTLSPPSQRIEAPIAIMREYQQNSGQLLASIFYFTKQFSKDAGVSGAKNIAGNIASKVAGGDPTKVYNNLYFGNPTGFVYTFPYFGDGKFNRETSFESNGDVFKPLTNLLSETSKFGGVGTGGDMGLTKAISMFHAISGVADLLVPGRIGVLPMEVQGWKQTTEGDVTISFALFNTSGNTKEIRKNRELAILLTHQNTPFRRNFAITDPTVIYDLMIPDVIHFPACYISSLNITNLGKTRSLVLDGEVRTIPEGYKFDITVRSLLPPSRNIFYGVENPSAKVTAISEDNPNDMAKEFLKGAALKGLDFLNDLSDFSGNANALNNLINPAATSAGPAVPAVTIP